MKNVEPLWTIDELGAEVASALAEGYDGPPNGRVRDVPDRRSIRYYTTIGLLDRASEMRGRTALYGRRHLLQLVAIKKLQAQGRSLAEVQRALAGQTDQALARVAGLDLGGTGRGGDGPSERAARDFWREVPAPHEPRDSKDSRAPENGQTETGLSEPNRPQMFHGIPLVDGVTLLLASSRPIDSKDLEAIRTAAGPLVDTLLRCQLIQPRSEGESR
ncbi:MAG: MerR family transcriptional regulator [Isosphaeraceae bacterium]